MQWIKPDPELIKIFDEAFPAGDGVERRKMFGYPCGFVNNNMFIGMHQLDFVARLPEERRRQLIDGGQARQFEPMPGRTMKEYIAIEPEIANSVEKLSKLFQEALEYASSLPPKIKKHS